MQDRQAIKESVRARIDMVDLVSRYVSLRQQGSNFAGLCPFHEEKSPSFTVSQEKGVFHCFGCKAGGDAFEFIMRIEKLDFPQALEFLANQVGIDIPKPGQKDSPQLQLRQLSEQIAKYYEKVLASDEGKEAVEYLKDRGLDGKTAKKFRIGYAKPGWQNLLNQFTTQQKHLKTLGMAVVNQQGRMYDRFRDRIMFPLCDAQGQVVGFAGRQLHAEEGAPKYVNTPVTPLLQKGTLLYGIHMAGPAARESGELILMEGYTDVIAAHQNGIHNAVASMGTALTKTQARQCARFTQRVILGFDQDTAGQLATLRGIQALLEEGLEVGMIQLEPGHDPDTYIQENGAEAFVALLKNSRSFFEMYIDMLLKQHDVTGFSGKQQVLNEAIPFLRGLTNLHWRSHLVSELASALDLPSEDITQMLRTPQKALATSEPTPHNENIGHLDQEEQLFYFLIHGHLSFERATTELADEDFARYGGLWKLLKDCYSQQGSVQLETLYEVVEDEWKTMLSRLSVSENIHADNITRGVEEVIRHFKRNRFEKKIRRLETSIREAESEGDVELAKTLQLQLLETQRSKNAQQ